MTERHEDIKLIILENKILRKMIERMLDANKVEKEIKEEKEKELVAV